jgi:hypothetical protein
MSVFVQLPFCPVIPPRAGDILGIPTVILGIIIKAVCQKSKVILYSLYKMCHKKQQQNPDFAQLFSAHCTIRNYCQKLRNTSVSIRKTFGFFAF